MASGPLPMKRPCIDCGRIGNGTRCVEHERAHDRERGTSAQRGYGSAWRTTSRVVLERDGYRCRYCGGWASTTDHITPKAMGGSDDEWNLVAACRACNSAKRDRTGWVGNSG